jgi:hypothetical protein
LTTATKLYWIGFSIESIDREISKGIWHVIKEKAWKPRASRRRQAEK